MDTIANSPSHVIERDRLPELAAHWGCTYIGLEIGEALMPWVEVHAELRETSVH